MEKDFDDEYFDEDDFDYDLVAAGLEIALDTFKNTRGRGAKSILAKAFIQLWNKGRMQDAVLVATLAKARNDTAVALARSSKQAAEALQVCSREGRIERSDTAPRIVLSYFALLPLCDPLHSLSLSLSRSLQIPPSRSKSSQYSNFITGFIQGV